jgi:hypothetical protein
MRVSASHNAQTRPLLWPLGLSNQTGQQIRVVASNSAAQTPQTNTTPSHDTGLDCNVLRGHRCVHVSQGMDVGVWRELLLVKHLQRKLCAVVQRFLQRVPGFHGGRVN